jgi:hypothetical protein
MTDALTSTMRFRPAPRVVRAVLAILALLATITAFGFLSGGYIFTRTAPVAFVFAGLVVAGVWLVRRPERPSSAHVVGLVALAGLVVWTGLSVLWSVGPDLSWVSFDVAAFYLLVAVVCGVLPGGRAQLRVAAYGLAVVVTVLAAYALLGKIAPDLVTNAHVFARLSGSIGYWNVLAAIIVMVVPIALEAASRPGLPPWGRGLVSSALVVLLFTFFFTFSRGGFLALGVALLVYFVLAARRLSGVASFAVPAVLVAAVLYRERHLATLFSATTNDALRAAQGHALARWVVAAVLIAFVAQVLFAYEQRSRPLSARDARVVGVAVLVVLVAAPLAFGAVYLPEHGGVAGWVRTHARDALGGTGPANSASRLTSLGTSGRLPWYREAIRGFRAHPLTGSGAGTFRFTNYLYRTQPWVVMHSHSQWLNILSELGLVGFVLFAVAVAGLVLAAFGRLRDRVDPERSLLAACQAAVVVFVMHMSIDWDWDMAVITVAFLLLAGVAAGYVRERGRAAETPPTGGGQAAPFHKRPVWRLSPAVRLLATGLVALGVVSWSLPYLSQGAAMRAVDEASRGRLAQAAASAQQAGRLDPLAVDPLVTLALVRTDQHRLRVAQTALDEAIRLQPRNYVPYYQMGVLEQRGFGQEAAAVPWFRRALALNPLDALTRQRLGLL